MNIDFTRPILDIHGKEIKDGEATLTLARAAVTALLSQQQDERLSAEQHLKHYSLAQRIQGAAEPVDLTAEETALIKERASKTFFTPVAAPVMLMLEGKA